MTNIENRVATDCLGMVESDTIPLGICQDVLDLAQGFQGPASGPWRGKSFHGYVTPFIIGVGLIGNVISLRVFTYTRLRKLSASLYLIALSVSDSCVLLTYVLCDWLLHGLPSWPRGHSVDVIHHQGLCQGFLFVSYVFRFVTVYLIIIFSIERYIAVCKPLQRQTICSKKFARKIISVVHVAAVIVSFYKPILSGIYPIQIPQIAMNIRNMSGAFSSDNPNITILNTTLSRSTSICTWNPDYENFHFAMELIYGLLITAIPFVIVTVLNVLILKQLMTKYFQSQSMREMFRKSKMKIELTIMVLAVSTCFVCLNIPYFIVWLIQHLQPYTDFVSIQRNSEVLSITRTIFSMNYSINFFVYCLTGSYYRRVIVNMLGCSEERANRNRNKRKFSTNVEVLVNHNTTVL